MKLNSFSYIQKEDLPHGKVILIGMMEDGPTGNPFILKNETKAKDLLGDNEVTRAYNTLIQAGSKKEDICLFRINGVPGRATLQIDNENVLVLQTVSSHSEERNITITTSMKGISIQSDYSEEAIKENKRKNFTATYLFEEHPYVSDLAEAITKDAALGIHGIIAESKGVHLSKKINKNIGRIPFLQADEEKYLIRLNGEFQSESIDDEDSYLRNYWDRFYIHVLGEEFDGQSSSKLMDIAAEVMYFPDLPIDETSELAILAGRAAKSKSIEQDLLCTSLFRTNKVPKKRKLLEGEYMNDDGTFYNIHKKEEEVWAPNKEKNEFIKKLEDLFTEEEKDFDEMKHVQIVVGEEETVGGEIIPGANYHLVNLINEELKSTTNKKLTNFTNVYSPLDKIAIDKLSCKGYICIVESIRRNAVTSKVQSLYNTFNFYDEFYYQKVLSYIEYDFKSILDKHIGLSNSLYQEYSIEDILNEYLKQYITLGILQSYSLGERQASSVNGKHTINIELVMYGQIDKLNGSIQLNNEGWEVDLWSQ